MPLYLGGHGAQHGGLGRGRWQRGNAGSPGAVLQESVSSRAGRNLNASATTKSLLEGPGPDLLSGPSRASAGGGVIRPRPARTVFLGSKRGL